MFKINLAPWREQLQRRTQSVIIFLFVLINVSIFLGLWKFIHWSDLHKKHLLKNITHLQQQFTLLKLPTNYHYQLQQQQSWHRQQAANQKAEHLQLQQLEVLTIMESALTHDISLDNITYQTTWKIAGKFNQFSALNHFVQTLSKHRLIHDLQITQISEQSKNHLTSFRISFTNRTLNGNTTD